VPVVTRVVVVDADTDLDVAELTAGKVVNLATAPRLNLRVETFPPVIGAVNFSLDGQASYRSDVAAPYSIGGDNIWDDYLPWTPALGNHSLTVTPRATDGTPGSPLTVAFSVIQQLPPGSPAAQAGADGNLVMPADSIPLAGSATGEAIVAHAWNQIAGPSVATLSGRNTATAHADDLVQGTYRFRLTVTNSSGLTGYDDVTVNVAPAPGAPVVNAGPDQAIVLPASSVTLTGTASDPASSLYFHLWTQLSGPSLAKRSDETTPRVTLSELVEGTYVFRLRAFSDSGLVGADDVAITVAAASDGISGFGSPVLGRLANGHPRLTFRGVPGRSYSFQRSVDLGAWFTLQSGAAGADGAIEFIDSAPPASTAFYRLASP
jgi:hypothetical protein